MATLFIDAETFSECDLRALGAEVYARHPSTRTLLWSVYEAEWTRPLVFEGISLSRILHQLKASKQIAWTGNEPLQLFYWDSRGKFDRLIAEYVEGFVESNVEWLNLGAFCLTYGVAGSLKEAAKFWGAGELKDEGTHLISRFCKPQKDGRVIGPREDPVRWAQFVSYAGQDTMVLAGIYGRMVALEGRHPLSAHRGAMDAVERLNDRGLPIDLPAVDAALRLMEAAEEALISECEETYGIRPSQTEAVRAQLDLPDVQKPTIEAWLREAPPDDPNRRLAEIRLELAGAARKKLASMRNLVLDDGVIRGTHIYHGAWTRRLTAQAPQPQNFVQAKVDESFFEALESGEDLEDLFGEIRQNIRGFIAAQPGDVLVAADYGAIELRVAAFLAGEQWLLDALEAGDDVYRLLAGDLYGIVPSEIEKESPERAFGKMVELASQFGLSGNGFDGLGGLWSRCQAEGIEISHAEAERSIQIYRRKHPAIVAGWEDCAKTFESALSSAPGVLLMALRCRFERHPWCVKVVRPSGFAQYYWLPQMRWGKWPDKVLEDGTVERGGPRLEITYVGRDKTGKMARLTTWGAKIFQGIVQGFAADLLLDAMPRVEEEGFLPIMSIHDELVCLIGESRWNWVERLCELLCEIPDWADGLPVVAEGWQGHRFTK